MNGAELVAMPQFQWQDYAPHDLRNRNDTHERAGDASMSVEQTLRPHTDEDKRADFERRLGRRRAIMRGCACFLPTASITGLIFGLLIMHYASYCALHTVTTRQVWQGPAAKYMKKVDLDVASALPSVSTFRLHG